MKLGFEYAKSMQEFQVIAKVLSMALGGGSKEDVQPPKTAREALAQLNTIFGG